MVALVFQDLICWVADVDCGWIRSEMVIGRTSGPKREQDGRTGLPGLNLLGG